METVYIDSLSFFSLLSVITLGLRNSSIYYFNSTPAGNKFADICAKLKIIQKAPEQVDFHLGEIRDDKGECLFLRINNDIQNTSFKISSDKFSKHHFLKSLGNYFDHRKILLFFEKTIATEINDTIVFMNAAKWHFKNDHNNSAVFYHKRSLWSKHLSDYAISLNIRPVEYISIETSRYFKYIEKIKQHSPLKLAAYIKKTFTAKCNKEPDPIKSIARADRTKPVYISRKYTGKSTVITDPSKRSAFFFFVKEKMPAEHILVYSDGYIDATNILVSQEMLDEVAKAGFKFVIQSNKSNGIQRNAVMWRPGATAKNTAKKYIKTIAISFLANMARLRFVPLFYIANTVYFIWQYAYWHDFFNSNGIKININSDDFARINIPMHLALEENGGISVSFQWSNLDFANQMSLSSTADVLFSFGPSYQWVWEQNHSVLGNLIYSGYVTDHSFDRARKNSLLIRKDLLNKGVKFIVCFFDENSSDDRMSVITHEATASTYKYFIEKLLSDETLGVIFKPSYVNTIYKRIASISGLIEKAKATGRCIFIDSGEVKTDCYPTETAQAADLCVGLLLSGTVSLESYLSGVPTILLDLEKLYSNDIYQWGKGKIVFNSLDDVFTAIDKYRNTPEDIPGFGDLSSWAQYRDPFKDGNASKRMGQYINWLLELFKKGGTRKEALEYANRKYADLWGSDNIIKLNRTGNKI